MTSQTLAIKLLRDASSYIHQQKNICIVIHLPYYFFENNHREALNACIQDIALLHALGSKIIVVYESSPMTDEIPIDQSLYQSLCQDIQTQRLLLENLFTFNARTLNASYTTPLISGNFLIARPKGVLEGVDYPYEGVIRRVHQELLVTLLNQGMLILIPPLGLTANSANLILNSRQAALKISVILQADKLIFIDELEQQLPRELSPKHIHELPQLSSRSQYLLDIAHKACMKQVKRTYLIDQTLNGGLLLELLTRDGAGCLVTEEAYDEIRQAEVDDIAGLLSLIRPLEEKKVLVPRTREMLEQEIHHYLVMRRDGLIIGCVAFYPYDESRCAELACLVIHQDYQGNKRAELLLAECEKKARHLGFHFIFVLTTQTTDWFIEHHFNSASLKDLPMHKQNLYNYQRNSKILIKYINN